MMKQGGKIDCQSPLMNFLAVTLMYFKSAMTFLLNFLNGFRANDIMM